MGEPTVMTGDTETNREIVRRAFEAWQQGTFYDSISFNDLWSRVTV